MLGIGKNSDGKNSGRTTIVFRVIRALRGGQTERVRNRGLSPFYLKFEMKLMGTGDVIRGTVAATLASRWLELIERPDERLFGQVWRTKMKIREIRERNRPPRHLFTLLGLIERR